jgi:hypothetical protein
VVSSTEYFVSNFFALPDITDNYLLTLGDHYAIDSTGIMGGSRATPAERFYLKGIDSICEFHQTS